MRVEDGQGGSNTIEVTINLRDETEPPEDPAAPSVSAASSTSLTVTWAEPANTGPDISDYDVQYREGDSGSFRSWSHNSAERTAEITSLKPGTSYQAQVLARNAEGSQRLVLLRHGKHRPQSAARVHRRVERHPRLGREHHRRRGRRRSGRRHRPGEHHPDLQPRRHGCGRLRHRHAQRPAAHPFRDETWDYETKSSYSVSVKAEDGHGGERTIPVFIELNDLNEPPSFTSDAAFEAAENQTFAGLVTAEDVDGVRQHRQLHRHRRRRPGLVRDQQRGRADLQGRPRLRATPRTREGTTSTTWPSPPPAAPEGAP